jgi:hypothetical protein
VNRLQTSTEKFPDLQFEPKLHVVKSVHGERDYADASKQLSITPRRENIPTLLLSDELRPLLLNSKCQVLLMMAERGTE